MFIVADVAVCLQEKTDYKRFFFFSCESRVNTFIVLAPLQLDLGSPSFPRRLLSSVARRQAAVIADLDVFLS